MMKRDLRIIYMGTPEFAVPSLEILLKNKVKVVAVITAPDKAAGRGLKIQKSPVKILAEKYSIPVLQPSNLKSETFQNELKAYKANLQIVVAFRMLPEVVWNMPELGTFNLHASLLPNYRGAAPINWAIINGEKETGLTTFFLKHEIDTGDIIEQVKEEISETDTASSLYERLMNKGAQLVLDTVKAIESDKVSTRSQTFSDKSPNAPKIFKSDCEIDWNRNAEDVYNFIRGLSAYPTAWTTLQDKSLKVFMASKEIKKHNNPIGSIVSDNKTNLGFYTTDGIIWLIDVQMESKKRMLTQDLLKGLRL